MRGKDLQTGVIFVQRRYGLGPTGLAGTDVFLISLIVFFKISRVLFFWFCFLELGWSADLPSRLERPDAGRGVRLPGELPTSHQVGRRG
jgi:hypothetical protein